MIPRHALQANQPLLRRALVLPALVLTLAISPESNTTVNTESQQASAVRVGEVAVNPCMEGDVLSDNLCIENPHGYPIIPSAKPALAENLKGYPEDLHCDTVFAAPACGPGYGALLTPAMLTSGFNSERQVASDDCYIWNFAEELCVNPAEAAS